MGSDALESGCKGVVPSHDNDYMKVCNKEEMCIDDKLITFIDLKLSMDTSVLEAYVEEIIYEPADEMKANGASCDKCTYFHYDHVKVHHHISDFMHPNDKNCVTLKYEMITYECRGYDNLLQHIYLHYERIICSLWDDRT